jgi:hypothetical protein
MRQAIKLESISAEGDAAGQKILQVKSHFVKYLCLHLLLLV